MTVSTTTVLSGPFTGDGAATAFPFTFSAAAADEIQVLADGDAISSALYSVALADPGGTVTFTTAPAADVEIIILSAPAFVQGLALQNNGTFLPEEIEGAFDRGTIIDLYLKAKVDSVVPEGALLPGAGAGMFLSFDAEGNPVYSQGTGADAGLREDLAADGSLVGFAHDFTDAPVSTVLNVLRGGPVVLLHMLRKASEESDNLALARAEAYGLPVYMQSGQGADDEDGAFLLDTPTTTNNLWPGIELFGDGPLLTMVRKSAINTNYFPLLYDSGSASPTHVNQGLWMHLHDFMIEDDPDRDYGFAEHQHLIMLSGVSYVTIERVFFKGFRGDGLHFGSNVVNGVERHNVGCSVRDCDFDGVDKNNRNGLTLIDMDGFFGENLRFRNLTRPGDGSLNIPTTPEQLLNPNYGIVFPGAIDIEPNANIYHVLRNITLRKITVTGCGGSGIAMLLLPNSYLTTPQRGFVLDDIVVTDAKSGLTFNGYSGTDAIPSSNPLHGISYDLSVSRLKVSGCTRPFLINGLSGGVVDRCDFADCDLSADYGYTDYNYNCTFHDSRLHRIGLTTTTGVTALIIRRTDTLTLDSCRFVDSGQAAATSGRHIYFLAGDIDRVRLLDNEFSSPQGRTTAGISIDAAANVNFGNCLDRGSVWLHSVANDFKPNGSPFYTSAPAAGTWAVGNIVENNAAAAAAVCQWRCTTAGTYGTLNSGATTGGITSGTATLVVNSATGLAKGRKITIVGVTGVKTVVSVSGTTITLDSNADATVAAAAVAYSTAVFKGAITLAA